MCSAAAVRIAFERPDDVVLVERLRTAAAQRPAGRGELDGARRGLRWVDEPELLLQGVGLHGREARHVLQYDHVLLQLTVLVIREIAIKLGEVL